MERACEEDPQSKECRSAGASLKRLFKKLNVYMILVKKVL